MAAFSLSVRIGNRYSSDPQGSVTENAVVYTRLGAGITTADAAHSAAFCVTGSVAVGTHRDGQDTTGHESSIEPYLAQRADFTREFANSADRPIRFSSPSRHVGVKDLRLSILGNCST
jgi:hypothetical protein